jgi:hypothetical protein
MVIGRRVLADSNARANRALFGKLGSRVADSSTPTTILLLGILAIVLGTFSVVMSFFYQSPVE